MDMCFWLKLKKYAQILASLTAKLTIFTQMKHLLIVKENQINGIIQCIKIAPIDL